MKPHLPNTLLRALRACTALSAVTAAGTLQAGVIRNDYSLQQYKDFALNLGQYRAGNTNVTVYKTDGTTTGYAIPVMPNLDSYCAIWGTSNGNGGGSLFSPQYVLTAAHLGTPTSGTKINFLSTSGDQTYYTGLTYRMAGYGTYGYDGMTIRLTKIVTEVAYTPLCTDTSLISSLSSSKTLLFRIGNGIATQANGTGYNVSNINPQSPLGGTLLSTSVTQNYSTTGNWRITTTLNQGQTNPLGISSHSGDSGSPLYVYNSDTGQFEIVGVCSTGTTGVGYGCATNFEYNPGAIQSTVDSYTDYLTLSADGEDLCWNSDDDGTITQSGDESVSYAYHGEGTSSSLTATKGVQFSSEAEHQNIYLTADIDMGYGSVDFNTGDYTLASSGGGDYTITRSAGFIVGEDASVEITLNGQGEEWRFVAAGTATISGSGDNNITLNVGGGVMRFAEDGSIIHEGEVRLNRDGGYAATEFTLSAGVATIVLMQDGQIAGGGENFTFGNMGGVLNLNGQDLTWSVINHSDYGATFSNTRLADAAEDHEQAVSTFTYTGTGTFQGSFTDGGSEADGLLRVVYQGSSSSDSWYLTGVSDNMGGYVVEEGTLHLRGYLTLHAGSYGSTTTIAHDYTYAVMQTSTVTVNDGGTFVLDHHALMEGDVVVNDGGTFVMKNTVGAAAEYIGGSQVKQDVTDFISLAGNVELAGETSLMQVDTSSSVAVNYYGDISGAGSFEKTGSGDLVLGGTNTFTGAKTLTAGTIFFTGTAALGDTSENRWFIGEQGVMVVQGENADDTLSGVDASSAGVLALDADQLTALDLSGHTALLIGATEGSTIQYGVSGTTETLEAVDGAWRFGGGGGTLQVNFKLTGEGDLIIGNDYSSGTVYLTNTDNDFSGNIIISGYNNYLTYDSLDALGDAHINIAYGNSMNVHELADATIAIIGSDSDGVLALYSQSGTVDTDIDFSSGTHIANASLGAADTVHYTGSITPNGGDYRFGGTGTLYLDTQLSGGGGLYVDAQGMSGGVIVLTQANEDFTGAVNVGGKLDSSSSAGTGTITLELQNGDALANASGVILSSGGILALNGTDALIHELSAAGGSIINSGTTRQTLTIDNDTDAAYSGALGYGSASLDIVKTGSGTLTLSSNSSYQGDITIREGAISVTGSAGLGSSDNTVSIEEGGTLNITLNGNFGTYNVNKITSSVISQSLTGTGTINLSVNQTTTQYTVSIGTISYTKTWSSTKSVVAFTQTEAFEGTVNVLGNSRLIIGSGLAGMSNLTALNSATVNVAAGSQAVVTNRLSNSSYTNSTVYCSTDFILNGTTYSGGYGSAFSGSNISQTIYGVDYAGSTLGNHGGALRVDCGSVLTGTVTLAADSAISSVTSSASTGSVYASAYGNSTWSGGTLLGAILGEGKSLTLAGNAQLTLKADSANTYGDLSITNTSGVRTAYGAAADTVSTALGTGTVSISSAAALTFGNAETGGTDIVYTYANDFTVSSASASLIGEYNTTKLTGSVTVTGGGVTLGAESGAALRLESGITGSDTAVTLTGGGTVAIGGEAGSFTGTITAETGSGLTILSTGALSGVSVDYSAAENFTLRLEGSGSFLLNALTGAASADDGDGTSSLSLHFDFSDGTAGSSLTVETLTGVTEVSVYLDLNSTSDIAAGTYTLIANADASSEHFTLASGDLDGRLTLSNDDAGNLILTVGEDARLFWQGSDGAAWDTESANWKAGGAGDALAYAEGRAVVFGSAGAAQSTITLDAEIAPGSVLVRDGESYTFTGSGRISGEDASLTVADGASLRLETAGNTFGGGAAVTDGGTLTAAAAGALSSTAVSLETGGTLELAAAGALTDVTITFNGGGLRFGADDITVSSGTLAEGESGVSLDLAGHSGLVIEADSSLAAAGFIFADSSGAAGSITLGSSDSRFTLSAGSSLSIGEGASVTHYAAGGTISTLEGGGDFALYTSAATTIADMSAFTGTITKSGGGTLTVSAISETADWVFSGRSWTSSTKGMNFNEYAADGATITLIGAHGGTGTGSYFSTGTLTFSQNFVLVDGEDGFALRISNGSSSGVITFAGRISGGGTLLLESQKVTQGIRFTGDLSSFTGGLTVSGVTASSSGKIARFILSDDEGATTYDDNDRAAGTGTISISHSSSTDACTLELDYAADHGLANAITGSGNIGKEGAGTVTLTGDLSGHTGAVTVTEGGLAISGTASLGSSSLSAAAQDTALSVSGLSSLGCAVDAADGAHVTLTDNAEVTSSITLGAGASATLAGTQIFSGTLNAAEGSSVTLDGSQEITGSISTAGGSVTVTGTAAVADGGSITAASIEAADGEDASAAVIRVTSTGSLSLGDAVQVTARDSSSPAELENVRAGGTEISSAGDGSYGAVTNGIVVISDASSAVSAAAEDTAETVAETVSANYTLADIDIVSSDIVNASAGTVTLSDVYVTSDSSVSNLGTGSVIVTDCILETGGAFFTLNGTTGLYSLELDNFSGVELAGSLTLELTEITIGSAYALDDGAAANLDINLSGTTFGTALTSVSLSGSSLFDYTISGVDVDTLGGTTTIHLVSTVPLPEPSASLLALLGAGALALRRRRAPAAGVLSPRTVRRPEKNVDPRP